MIVSISSHDYKAFNYKEKIAYVTLMVVNLDNPLTCMLEKVVLIVPP